MGELGEIGVIEDVNKGIHKYVVDRWKVFLLPAGVFVLLGFWIPDAYILIFFGGLLVLAGVAIGKLKMMEAFMRQFASINNFAYLGSAELNSVLGSLFRQGHSRNISYLVAGERGGHELRFFFYYYTVGSGKHKKTYAYTVCEIKMKGEGPDIIVESRGDWDFQSYVGEHQKEIPVESAFREHFAVFAPDNFEIETLEIFTPDVMSELISNAKQYNFEFINDRLYVFRHGEITKKTELEEFLKFAKYLVDAVAPKVFRLSDDVRALKEAAARNRDK